MTVFTVTVTVVTPRSVSLDRFSDRSRPFVLRQRMSRGYELCMRRRVL